MLYGGLGCEEQCKDEGCGTEGLIERSECTLRKSHCQLVAVSTDLSSSEKNIYKYICMYIYTYIYVYMFKLGSIAGICQYMNQGNG